MGLELKDITEYTGVEAKDLDEFKKKFAEKFITKAEASKDESIIQPIQAAMTGRMAGYINTFFKRELGLSVDDLEGKKYEEVLTLVADKYKSDTAALKELAGKGVDEKVKELEAKYEKVTKTLSEEKEAKELLKKTLEEKEADYNGKIKNLKIGSVLASVKEKIAPKLVDLNEEQKFYYESKIKESIKIDFDDKDNPIVLGADGKRIPNPNKAGDFLGIEDALLKIAEERNYIKKNAGGTIASTIFTPKVEKQEPSATDNQRKVHPSALKHVEVLASSVEKK